MSLTINAQLFGKLECRMDDLRAAIAEGDMGDAQKMMERTMKAFAEIRGTSTVAAGASEEVSKGKKSRKTKGDGEPKPKKEVVPGSWPDQLQKVYAPVINEAWGSEKKPAGILMKVAGYLKKNGKTEPTVKDAREAIKFIRENPDYKSDTQISRSAENSVEEEAPKKKRAYKKKAVAEEAPKTAGVIAVLNAVMDEAKEDEEDEKSDDEEEDDEEDVPLATFEYKGNNYLKDPYQEVYTAEGKIEWVGTFNGKKIVKGEMKPRVKKFIESQD